MHRFLKEDFNKLDFLDESYLNVEFLTDRAVILKTSEKFKEKYKQQRISFLRPSKPHRQSRQMPNTTYSITNDYANLGWSLESADLNNDQSDDLIISAPVYSKTNLYQNGAVFVLLTQNKSSQGYLDVEKSADRVVFPPENVFNSRFGHSVVALDLNQDGFNDLVVSAPSYNLRNISYEVIDFIYLAIRLF